MRDVGFGGDEHSVMSSRPRCGWLWNFLRSEFNGIQDLYYEESVQTLQGAITPNPELPSQMQTALSLGEV